MGRLVGVFGGESRPPRLPSWIPAFAGMTKWGAGMTKLVGGTMGTYYARTNDGTCRRKGPLLFSCQ